MHSSIMKTKKSLKYRIKFEGFNYHINKQTLKKGSLISPKKHPIFEVEDYKKFLIRKKNVTLKNGQFYLNRNINVGLIFAYNLYSGKIETKMPEYKKNELIFDRKFDEDHLESVKNIYQLKNIYPSNDLLYRAFNLNSIKIESIEIFKIYNDFFTGSNADTFSNSEKFAAEVLEEINVLPKGEYRHGDNLRYECDIVDEKNAIQYEITFGFNNIFAKNFSFSVMPERILLDHMDNNFEELGNNIIEKIFSKKYTNKYVKNLVIVSFGGVNTCRKIVANLHKNINKKNKTVSQKKINLFKKIIFINYSFSDKNLLVFNGSKFIKLNNEIIKKYLYFSKKIEVSDIEKNKDKKFLVIIKNIFKQESAFFHSDYDELKEFISLWNL